VSLALKARDLLAEKRIGARVVSLPSWEVFEEQDESYREAVLPSNVKARVSVEAGSVFGWQRFVGDAGASVGIDHFGASAPGGEVMKRFGFTPEHVAEVAEGVVRELRAGGAAEVK
jgi:transketolase